MRTRRMSRERVNFCVLFLLLLLLFCRNLRHVWKTSFGYFKLSAIFSLSEGISPGLKNRTAEYVTYKTILLKAIVIY